MKWENKAKILYEGTTWATKAIAAGKAIDNKLNGEQTVMASHSNFDMAGYLAYFDYEVLRNRKLLDRIPASL